MDIGGFQGVSLIDFPGEITSIVFTTGCNFKCPFCHNGALVRNEFEPVTGEQVLEKLKGRKDFITAVTVTGGEPTIQSDLVEFLTKIRKLDVKVKLDTNGSRPEVLKEIVSNSLVDYFAMDIKAPFSRYEEVAGTEANLDKIKESIELIKDQKKYEFRTTVVPDLLSPEEILKTAKQVKGAQKYALQQFEPRDGMVAPEFKDKKAYSPKRIKEIGDQIKDWFGELKYRGMEE